MPGLRSCAVLLAALAASCRPREPVTSPGAPSPTNASTFAQPVARVEQSRPALAAIRFEAVAVSPPPEPLPHVEIVRPLMEQRLAADKAKSQEVGLQVENWALAQVDVSLDDFEPRRADTLPKKIILADLVPADGSLDPGQHLLVATAVTKDGALIVPPAPRSRAPFAAITFWVGDKSEPRYRPDRPILVYRQPRGTYNGAQARVLLDFLILGRNPGVPTPVRVVVRGERASGECVMNEPGAVLLSGLPSGDYDVILQLLGFARAPLDLLQARVGRTITVNRDAPVGP